MSLPFFSIIIPTYCRPEQLTACLDAIANLDYPHERFEVIVVDDGSVSPPYAVVASFSGLVTVKLLRQPHAGPATARNKGATSALGDFLVFTDDDCEPDEHWLRALAGRFAASPEHLIGGRTLNALPGNFCSAASHAIIEVVYEHFNGAGDALFFASNNFAAPADIFRRLGGFDEAFITSEDREFCDRWTHRGYSLTYAREALVRHAHSLTLGTLWRQHFGYGRGAYQFHRLRRLRDSARINPDRRFYFKLLRYPSLAEKGYRAVALTFLVCWTQLASTAGFVCEMIKNLVKSRLPVRSQITPSAE